MHAVQMFFQITPIRLMLNLSLDRFHSSKFSFAHSPHSSFTHSSTPFQTGPQSSSSLSSTISPSLINSLLDVLQPRPKENMCWLPMLMNTAPWRHSFLYSWDSCMHKDTKICHNIHHIMHKKCAESGCLR